MAFSSEEISGLRLTWRMERQFMGRSRRSSIFSFLDAEWSLEINIRLSYYFVYLQKESAWKDLRPFEATTWIECDRRKGEHINGRTVTVGEADEHIWGIPEVDLLKELPELMDDGDFTIVCTLNAVSPSGLKKETQHQSIQVSLDFPPNRKNFFLYSRGPLKREPSSDKSIQVSFEFPPDLDGLSLDFSKLLEKDAMPDVELKCSDGTVPAHRAVLSARSEVFSAMFRNDMTERRTGIVDVPDVESNVLELILKYAYTGKMPEIPQDLIPRLYAASNKYAIHGLKKACSEWMTGGLTEENYLEYLVLADAHGDASFKDAVVSFIADNQGMLLRNRAWFRFSEEQLNLTVEVYHRCFARLVPGDGSLYEN